MIDRSAPRPLLVGELNPYGSDPRYALYPEPERSAGGRLCRLVLALSVRQYIKHFDRANLCVGKWSTKAAREEARKIAADPTPRSAIVLLGTKVRDAFGIRAEPFTLVASGFGYPAVILPHPSGLNRVWNERGAFERARGVLREAGVLPVPEAAPSLPRTEWTTERPAFCSNCGIRVEGVHCTECGPP